MGWLAYEVTGSPFLVGIFTAIRLSPTFLGPFFGTIADRINRQKFIIVIQASQVFLASAMAFLIMTNQLQFWQLTLIGFLDGVIWSSYYTTSFSLTMDIVGEKDISNAVALNIASMGITRVIGPAVGGIIIASLGPANCFWLVALFNILAICFLIKPRMPRKTTSIDKGTAWQDIRQGFKYVISHRSLLSVLIVSFTANIFLWPAYQSFMPIFAKDNLGLGPDGLGYILTSMGAGAFISSIFIASLGDFSYKGILYLGGTALMTLFFGIFAISRTFPIAITFVALAGLFSTAFNTMQSTITLKIAPEDMRGRCMGFLSMAIGIYSLGSLAMGAIANIYGAGPTTAVSCAILLLLIMIYSIIFPSLRKVK